MRLLKNFFTIKPARFYVKLSDKCQQVLVNNDKYIKHCTNLFNIKKLFCCLNLVKYKIFLLKNLTELLIILYIVRKGAYIVVNVYFVKDAPNRESFSITVTINLN